LGRAAPQHVDGNGFRIANLRANEIKEHPTQRAPSAAIGNQQAAIRFHLLRLGNKCLRSLRADGTNNTPNRGAGALSVSPSWAAMAAALWVIGFRFNIRLVAGVSSMCM
jgi:hypothetical protein